MTVQYQGVWSLQSAAQLQSTQRWVTDPLFENTTLLLQADDAANGAQNNTFLDSSSNSFAITRNGNTTQGSFTPFSAPPGAWSNLFGGYAVNSSTILATNTSTFTIEAWIFPTVAPVTTSNIPSLIGDMQATGSTAYWSFGILASGALSFYWFDSAGRNATSAGTVPINAWSHIAVSVNSNAITLYINGVQQALTGTTTLANRGGSTSLCTIAQFSNANSVYTGFISNLSVLSGTAKYSSSFTPSTTPLPTGTTNQVLLFGYGNSIGDANTATTPKTFTITSGTPAVSAQPFSPFAPQFQWTPSVIGGSGSFDGTGDNLTIAGNAAFAFGTGDFTLEAWVNPNSISTGTFDRVCATSDFSGSGFDWNMNSGATQLFLAGASYGFSINTRSWNHIVFTRSGSALRGFLNGRLAVYSAPVGQDITSTTSLLVGQGYSGTNLNGYMTDLRIIKGSIPTAYQTSATTTGTQVFTAPTAPLTTTSQGATAGNVSLLLNYTNAGIYDGTMENNVETVGNAQVNTAVVKYGSGSMAFDGAGDYLRAVPTYNPLLIEWWRTSYTLEFWVYANAINTVASPILVAHADPGAATNFWSFGPITGGTIQFYYFNGAGNNITTTTAIATGQWYHLAFVNNNNAIAIYINGVQSATGIISGAPQNNTGLPFLIGGFNGAFFNGYIDDFRVTRFARYTQNFIPPSVALPRQ